MRSPGTPRKKTEKAPPGSDAWPTPWVQLRSVAYHPFIYRRMVLGASPDAAPGDLVAVYDKKGERFGSGFYNPRSRIALRMVTFDDHPATEGLFRQRLATAVTFRHRILGLPERTDAYRVVHAEGDDLSGLIVDRLADVLAVQVLSYGVYRKLSGWLPVLHELLGTRKQRVQVDPQIARLEGFEPVEGLFGEAARAARIREHGVRFAVQFEGGHKTGFFCDQRENRRRLSELVGERTVLDLCCYTGGFAIYARAAGAAAETTGVDLDEAAIAQARHNGNLNQVRVRWVHADAFSYARQMQQNGRQWDVVVLDPPKFIASRGEIPEGKKKYFDLNRLAISLVAPGGLLVSCSCSGLLAGGEFEKIVVDAAHRWKRRLQFLDRTGAGPDHPVMSHCPESRYLKVLWARVL